MKGNKKERKEQKVKERVEEEKGNETQLEKKLEEDGYQESVDLGGELALEYRSGLIMGCRGGG